MKLEVDPKLDIAFKRVFGTEDNAPILIDMLSAVVLPVKPVTGLDIVRTHSEKDTPLDKQVIADIKARDQGNRQFHIEMQGWAPWFFPNRVLFYWAKFHSQQLREGEDYQPLRPTIFVCFANQIIYPEEDDFHLVFRLLEVNKGKQVFSDAPEIHLIELPKFTKTVEQLSTALDRWCYFLRHGTKLDLEHLPASLDVPMIRRAMEVLTVFTQDEHEREAYEQRLKFQRDQSSFMREVREARAFMEEFATTKQEADAAKQELATAKQEVAVTKQQADAAKQQADAAKQQADAAKQQADAAKQQADAAKQEVATAKQQADAAKQQARAAEGRGIEKGSVMGQIRAFQEILKQPQTPEVELAAMSQDDLAALLVQLRKQLLSNGG